MRMEYKRNFDHALARLKDFSARKMEDQILAALSVPNTKPSATAIEFEEGEVSYPDPDFLFDLTDAELASNADVEDDCIPYTCLNMFDQGIYAAGLGGAIRFLQGKTGHVSSMSEPLVSSIEEAATLTFDPNNEWLQEFRQVAKRWAERAHGKFAMAALVTIDALNFIAEVRGATEALMDLMLKRDICERIMTFALDYNVAIAQMQHEVFEHFDGGSALFRGIWGPGHGVFSSVDAYHLCSSDIFEEAGREYVQELYDRTGHSILHVHGNGWHLLDHVRSLKNLAAITLMQDLKGERPFDHIVDLKKRVGDVPLCVGCTWTELCDGLKHHTLPGGVRYGAAAPSIEEANRAMKEVRAYRW